MHKNKNMIHPYAWSIVSETNIYILFPYEAYLNKASSTTTSGMGICTTTAVSLDFIVLLKNGEKINILTLFIFSITCASFTLIKSD